MKLSFFNPFPVDCFPLYAVSDHFCCSSERLWVKYVCENLFSEFVHIVITIAPRSCSSRAFFFFCDVRVDPNIGGNVACPNVCRSGILAHFPIRHKNSTRASFSKQIFEKDNMRMLGCIVSVAGRGGFSVSGCGDFRSCPTNDKPTTEGAPTNRPPCHLKWTCLSVCDFCACCNAVFFFFFKVGIFVRFFGGV